MPNDRNLEFIKNRIMDTGQVVMYRYIDETHKQIMGIKKAIVFDEKGQLYFPLYSTFERKYCDDIFPVELFFYKKGNPFYLTARGVAERWLKNIIDFKEKPFDTSNILCIKMNEVQYAELPLETSYSFWSKWIKNLTNIHGIL